MTQLVTWPEEHGHFNALMTAACEANPTNTELQAVRYPCDWAKLDAWDPGNEPVAGPNPGMTPFSSEEAEHFDGCQSEVIRSCSACGCSG